MCAVPTVAPDQVTFSTMSSARVGVGDRLQAGGEIDVARACGHRHASRLQRAMPAMRRCGADDRRRLEDVRIRTRTSAFPAARTRRWRRRARASSASSRQLAPVHADARPLAAERRAGGQHGAHRPARSNRGSVRPVTVITSGSARNTDDQTRDPAAIDHRIAVRQRQHIAAALGHRLTRRRADAGRLL